MIRRVPRGAGSGRRIGGLGALALLVAVVGACGSTTPSGSAASAAASGSSGPSPATSGATPRPTSWPGSTAAAVIALGAGNQQIGVAIQDLQKAVNNDDPRAMLGAAGGFNRLLRQLEPNIELLNGFPVTQLLADRLRRAFDVLIPATQALNDDLAAGRSSKIAGDVRTIGQGLTLYETAIDPLAALVPQALEQQRLLTE